MLQYSIFLSKRRQHKKNKVPPSEAIYCVLLFGCSFTSRKFLPCTCLVKDCWARGTNSEGGVSANDVVKWRNVRELTTQDQEELLNHFIWGFRISDALLVVSHGIRRQTGHTDRATARNIAHPLLSCVVLIAIFCCCAPPTILGGRISRTRSENVSQISNLTVKSKIQ